MSQKRNKRQPMLWLLRLHALLYGAGWVLALRLLSVLNIADDNFATYTHLIAFVLLWTPLLALHVGLYFYAVRWKTPNDGRLGYRQGYADALCQFADRAYNERPFVADEDELTELPEKPKRGG